ncbi:glutathione S-transferase [Desulfuromonas versatilis]|uniref:Glutathione S-transferase n=1 Tax=Desulfuromonas versatilis TaxID=2802975 RepID=A0ABM8HXR7_9BACT|nr:glutathione S-transferase family protein [Desulfuromonas versatilis]BCR05903.1 glutathione S-transferase [Desulfuromonas versatilis]
METIELFSSRVCPFAHRSRLALMEKGIPFRLVEIDLRNKPSWYREVTPTGAVPALRQGEFLLRESLIINEYVDELAPDPPLLPASAQQRAQARLWIDFAAGSFVPLFYRLLKSQHEEQRQELRGELQAVLATLDQELQRRAGQGHFWFGRQVGLTDIAFYPWFERWAVLEHYRDFPLPEGLSALRAWIGAMQQREAVRLGGQPAQFYIAEYEDYARGRK